MAPRGDCEEELVAQVSVGDQQVMECGGKEHEKEKTVDVYFAGVHEDTGLPVGVKRRRDRALLVIIVLGDKEVCMVRRMPSPRRRRRRSPWWRWRRSFVRGRSSWGTSTKKE